MNRATTLLRQALRYGGSAVVSFVVWTIWLGLAALLAFQIYIISRKELSVPAWLLQSLEQRLEVSGIRAKFGRTSFDPSGRLLIEEADVRLASFTEPVLSARVIYVRLDPWSALLGRFEPRELRVAGGRWFVPAMLSTSGRIEEVVSDFDTTLRPGTPGEIMVDSLTARIAGLSVNAHGTVYLPASTAEKTPRLPGADFIANRFAALSRQLGAVAEKMSALDHPVVDVELAPSESRGAIATVTLFARGVKLATPFEFQATNLRLATRFPLLGETPVMTRLEVAVDELRLPRNAIARGVHAQVRGPLKPALLQFDPTELDFSANLVEAEGLKASALSAQLTPGPLPRLQGELVARVMGAPLAVQADTHFTTKTAVVHFDGAIGPGWLELISQRVGRDVRQWVDFKTPITVIGAEATFSAGWKFDRLQTRFTTGEVLAYHVPIDDAHGRVELTPQRFFAPEAYARIKTNFARGSYDQHFASKDFRFLLEGQLEPLAISGWFTSWWPDFFKNFAFAAAPPTASVDVAGRWGEGRQSTVFVFADMNAVAIRGTRLDRARTLLFIRPGFYDGSEVLGTLGSGRVRGKFTYRFNLATATWQEFDFEGTSSLDLDTAAGIIGEASAEWLAPFKFERPPVLKLRGQLTRDAANLAHQDIHLSGQANGAFHFYDFPLERLAFKADLHDDEIAIEDVVTGFAGGVTTGRAKITGRQPSRRLNLDFTLKDASLGRAITILQGFAAKRKGEAPSPPDKFIQEKNNVRLNLTGKAEGNYSDPFSYHGQGTAELKGAELGELRMLGGLSETLRFTALRFTTATANFQIEGQKLIFPEISVTGDNSAIQAHGEYALDRRQLDFNAKLHPFQESGFILKKILDVALSPLSNVFEVKLTGTLDKPSWGLVLGPANFLRNLTQPEPEAQPAKPDVAPKSAAPAVPTIP